MIENLTLWLIRNLNMWSNLELLIIWQRWYPCTIFVFVDESTNNQVKKQYDGYFSYWSPSYDIVVSVYAGLLCVGHCNAGDVVKHYNHFVDKLELKSDYLLHLVMDGTNVNLSFQNKLESNLEGINTSFLRIGTCSLHPTCTAFRKGIKILYSNTIKIPEEKEKKNRHLILITFSVIYIFSLNCLVQGRRAMLLLEMLWM